MTATRSVDAPNQCLAGVTVAAGHALGLIQYAESRGAHRAALLSNAGINATVLHNHFERIPLLQYAALLAECARVCEDPALAIHFATSTNCADLSIIALICAACLDVQEAVEMLDRYGRIALDVGGIDGNHHYKLKHTPAGTWLIDNRQHFGQCPSLTEITLVRMATNVRRMFDPSFVRAVHFAHSAPGQRAEYERVLGVPVHFDMVHNGILFDPEWLKQPLAKAPRYSLAVLTAHADALLAQLEQSRTVRGRVETVLLTLLKHGQVSLGLVAATLAMSRPTLYRALKSEGTTYARVLDELRYHLAKHYLDESGSTVNSVSHRIDFSDPAAFSRAYRRWTGRSPRARQVRADA
ncbi:MAG: AraC family transcriptional regulator ligand-binding domain-containing protein [Gemmatimonadaceae bacterium]